MDPNNIHNEGLRSQAGWLRIPAELRRRPQWTLAGADKSPLTINGARASVTDPTTWTSFEVVCAAAKPGQFIGYMLSSDDPFTCIDLDVKDDTPPQSIEGYKTSITNFDSYTEHSRSGRGYHIWLLGKIGAGRRRDGVEVYSQERFIICTGNVVLDRPIAARPDHLTLLLKSLTPEASDVQLPPDDPNGDPHYTVALEAYEDQGQLGHLFRTGEWEGKYPSPSEADLALVTMLARLTTSNSACWAAFQMSPLGKRMKNGKVKSERSDYRRRTLQLARRYLANETLHVAHGRVIADALTGGSQTQLPSTSDSFKFKFSKPGESTVQIDYLVDPWLPRAMVIGCYGRGEAGKSSWTASGCAAVSYMVSTLWISSEEDESHIRARHLGCGGQINTLAVLVGTPTKIDPVTKKAVRTSFNIYEHLELAIGAFKSNPEARTDRPLGIVVLDAIVALASWAKGESPNDDAAVKKLIAFLTGIAEKYRLTILMLGHLNKRKHDQIADSVLGAVSWTSSPRVSYMFTKDEEVEFQGFVRTVKQNTGTHYGATYRTHPVHVLRLRTDGKPSVLCGAAMDETIWGDMALREAVATEDDPYLNKIEKKRAKVQAIVDKTLGLMKTGPTTRKAVEAFLVERVSKRHWQDADKILHQEHGVQMQNIEHNVRVYSS